VTSDDARHRFTRAIMPHLDDAYSLARWLTGNASDAEDVVQDACLRALAALEGADVTHPRAWLLTVTRNVAFTWLAKNRPRDLVLAGGAEDAEAHDGASARCDEPSPEAALIEAADRRSIEAAIAALPIPFREALVMREVNGLSYREIADATGAPIGTVMSRLARARALLIDRLGRTSQ
jgi:RNA polymerase sigma-70 factor (ECF subfamily)